MIYYGGNITEVNSIEEKIVELVLNDIQEKRLNPDEKLKSENEMAAIHKVPRLTIRKAYNKLAEMGYIYKKPGIGSFVSRKRIKIELSLSGKVSFSEKMKSLGYNYMSKNTGIEKIQGDTEINTHLNIDTSENVYKISRVRYINEIPIAVHTSYVSEKLFPDIKRDGKKIESLFSYYKQKGYSSFESSSSNLSIVYPTIQEQELIKCPNLVPLLKLETCCISAECKTVLDYSVNKYRSDCFTYIIKTV
jgi:GntR family transcriptional regulator